MAPAVIRRSAAGSSLLQTRDDVPLSAADFTPGLPAYPQPDIKQRSPTSVVSWPLQPSHTLDRRDEPVNPSWNPSLGTRPPESFNNKGYFALFALLGAAMVIAGIWFFFWADNGGFKWKQGDWDDYKSTVLRRKDKYGNTLSNATPRTNLGQKSVAGTFDYEKRDPEMAEMAEVHSERPHRQHRHKRSHRPHHERGNSDEDMKAYRQERSAKVGGLNRQHDGSHYDFTNSDYSYSVYTPSNADETMSNNSRTHLQSKPAPPPEPEPKKGFLAKKKEQRVQKKEEKKVVKDQKKVEKAAQKEQKKASKSPPKSSPRVAPDTGRIRPSQRRPSLSTLDDASTVPDSADYSRGSGGDSYQNMYRPEQPAFARSYGNRGAQRRSSPRTSPRASPRASPRPTSSPSEPRQPSPLKREFRPQPPGTFDAYSDAGSSDTGTKVYQHHIPRSNGTPSRSNGYRRGGRRDSLSDSD